MHVRIHHAAELRSGNYHIAIIYIPADLAGHLQFFRIPRLACSSSTDQSHPADANNVPLFSQFILNKKLYYSNQPVPVKGLDILEINIGVGHHEEDHSDDEVLVVHHCALLLKSFLTETVALMVQ